MTSPLSKDRLAEVMLVFVNEAISAYGIQDFEHLEESLAYVSYALHEYTEDKSVEVDEALMRDCDDLRARADEWYAQEDEDEAV